MGNSVRRNRPQVQSMTSRQEGSSPDLTVGGGKAGLILEPTLSLWERF
jgi:hypothetical protein